MTRLLSLHHVAIVALIAWATSCVGGQPVAATEAAPATWAFAPPRDGFSAESLLDLRSLNERVAGETGFVRADAHGDFVRGDGQPIRFWAVNSDVARHPFTARPLGPTTAPDLARHARFLAKRGVNLVRQHRQLSPALDAPFGDINPAERDAIWRMVAAMRAEGIYSAISPYWAIPMKLGAGWGIAGGTDQSAAGLLFFDATLQSAYRSWLKQLFTEKNPYTGVALAQDASVALVQIQNEDSLLFWTVGSIHGAQRDALETRFAQFAARKHGSIAKALAAWNDDAVKGDAPEAGRLTLIELWALTQAGRGDWPTRPSSTLARWKNSTARSWPICATSCTSAHWSTPATGRPRARCAWATSSAGLTCRATSTPPTSTRAVCTRARTAAGP